MTMINLKGKDFHDYEVILDDDAFVRLVEQHMGADSRDYIQGIINDRDDLERETQDLQCEIDDLYDRIEYL